MIDQMGRWYPDYPGQQPYQDPQYMRAIGQPVPGHQQMSSPNQQQDMTPTIRAEIKQVDDISSIDKTPLGAGESKMFMTKDEKHIIIRSMYANGQHEDKVYEEKPPAPPAPKFDPAEYVRKDEVSKLVKDALSAYVSAAKKEEK